MVGGRSAPLSAPSLAGRRRPRRSEDLAWLGARRPARARQHADPSLPDRGRDQPQAARRRSSSLSLGGTVDTSCALPRRSAAPSSRQPNALPPARRARLNLNATPARQWFFNRPRVHFMRNALAHAGKSGRRVVSAFIATAFAQDHADAARAQWRQVADQVRPKLPKLAALLDEAEEDVLAYMTFGFADDLPGRIDHAQRCSIPTRRRSRHSAPWLSLHADAWGRSLDPVPPSP